MHYKHPQQNFLLLSACGWLNAFFSFIISQRNLNLKNYFSSHADKPDESHRFTNPGYLCPQCLSKHCELPVECRACGLTLVSAPHLARSYHYLFPIKHFKEIEYDGNPPNCYSCQKIFRAEVDKKVIISSITY